MRRLLLLVILPLFLAPARADAITLREILELSRAGLSDEVLVALIEVDGGVFAIDTATLTTLKNAGLSERVIVAMVRSGRTPPPIDPVPVVPPEPPQPQVIVIEHEQPVIREVVVPVPVYVPVVSLSGRVRPHTFRRQPYQSLAYYQAPAFGVVEQVPSVRDARQHKPAEPVYWGWGGKLRPDAWKPK